jgi:predicted TIM-barrel fold metal-dependent hydrolase
VSELGSQSVRAQLDHPVVDTDGHVQEYMPAVLPYLREALGQSLFDEYTSGPTPMAQFIGGDNPSRRAQTRTPQSAWSATPARNTRDLATAVLPRLLHERMDEFGIDFSVLYPSKGLGTAGVVDDELRQGLCRGFNQFFADAYGPYADRLTASGIIPMHTPEEAVAEIEHCKAIGLKVVGLPEGVLRPIPEPGVPSPWLLPGQAHWFDTFGLDSIYDYDPVWAKLVECGFAATFHGGLGYNTPFQFTSISSYVFNHIGFFEQRMHRLCKSLFMGGVTRRFPTLKIAFLECGVGWASTLLANLVEHWERRNLATLESELDPALIDWAELERLAAAYGGELLAGTDVKAALRRLPAVGVEPEHRDEWCHVGLSKEEDLYDRFVPSFFFGCEADDRTLAFAFSDANVFEAKLQAMFSSDISHCRSAAPRRVGKLEPVCGWTIERCLAARMPAPISTSCATRTTRRRCSVVRSETAACSASKKRFAR